ncbi:hypothetical protein H072_8097 [Dactylellina haptotyla CBS 200.50]|uniref:ATP-grasp domain-containing protein n=1 Tax=Dactylellina haptotyla (strain CBS 200.50) TaxID=1284197 RepID=S8A5G2_DACHA|nr:hypothetical protein H072_8097 [Dactylellina haptotyla CBS 200.50]
MSGKILFLKTLNGKLASTPSDKLLFETLCSQGFVVDERSWYHPHPELGPLTVDILKTYHTITFIACWDYNLHIEDFESFLKNFIIPARDAGVKVVNCPELLLWNSNKVYLKDLENDLGIAIPKTIFVDTAAGDAPLIEDIISRHQDTHGAGVVVKPSVSASGKETYKIPELGSPTYDPVDAQEKWEKTYRYTRSLSASAKAMVQPFESAIKRGEFSVIFLGGEYSHTMLKKPAGDNFVAIEEEGATIRELHGDEVPLEGKEIGRKVLRYVKERFGDGEGWRLGYLRLDGVVNDAGKFVVIEAEMFEPYVYLDVEGAREGLERLCKALTE